MDDNGTLTQEPGVSTFEENKNSFYLFIEFDVGEDGMDSPRLAEHCTKSQREAQSQHPGPCLQHTSHIEIKVALSEILFAT